MIIYVAMPAHRHAKLITITVIKKTEDDGSHKATKTEYLYVLQSTKHLDSRQVLI